jgi:hypothetical protein
MQATEPPELVIRRCREVIDEHAQGEDHDRLLTVTQVFTRLRYKDSDLHSILGRPTKMIQEAYEFGKSLLIRDIVGEQLHKMILELLRTRFGPISFEVESEVRSILDESVLRAVNKLAALCPDIEQFVTELRAIPRPPEPWDPADEPEPKA